MAYPPIPRDANGVPIPVVWDDSINNWKVYKGPNVFIEHVDIDVDPFETTVVNTPLQKIPVTDSEAQTTLLVLASAIVSEGANL